MRNSGMLLHIETETFVVIVRPEGRAGKESERFPVFEHTADSGIVAYGRDAKELFANAAYGMFATMANLDGVRERSEESVRVEARDFEGLMVSWLTELLYHVDAQELLFCRFEIDEVDGTHIVARAFGEKIDRDRHELHLGIKAVTRHMLEVGRKGDQYQATILFDI